MAFFLNLAFTVIEVVGGIFTNSVAILSDAIHDLGDSLSIGLAWYLQRLSRHGRTPTFTYGYKRFGLLGAILTSVVLVAGSVIIIFEAVPRLFDPPDANAPGMIGLAVLGVVVNGLAVLRTRRGTSLNEQVVSLHLLEDVLGWAVVLVGALAIYLFDLPIIDPLLSLGITLFILYNVMRRLQRAGRIILQAAPETIKTDDIKRTLREIAGIGDVYHTHLWSLDGEYNIVTVHIQVPEDTAVKDLQPLKDDIRRRLAGLDIEHVTIEFEAGSERVEC